MSERSLSSSASLSRKATTRKMSLTKDGHAFLPRARRILEEAPDGRDELAERRGELKGPLRLSAPVSFGFLRLAPALVSFMKRHPRIAVSLKLDDRFVDIVSDLVAHRLAPGGRLLIASLAYLATHEEPRSLEALEGRRAILYSHRENTGGYGVRVVRPTTGLRVNNGMFIKPCPGVSETVRDEHGTARWRASLYPESTHRFVSERHAQLGPSFSEVLELPLLAHRVIRCRQYFRGYRRHSGLGSAPTACLREATRSICLSAAGYRADRGGRRDGQGFRELKARRAPPVGLAAELRERQRACAAALRRGRVLPAIGQPKNKADARRKRVTRT